MSREAAGVRLDPRGHIVVEGVTEAGTRFPLVTLVNTGNHLDLWAYQGATLTPDMAAALSHALKEWADNARKSDDGDVDQLRAELRVEYQRLHSWIDWT